MKQWVCDRCGRTVDAGGEVAGGMPQAWNHIDVSNTPADLCGQCSTDLVHFIKNPPPRAA